MSKGLIFWILMLLWLVFGFWVHWPVSGNFFALGPDLLLFILLLLLGWSSYGPPIQG